jgi:hypothetical protein
MSFLRSPAVVTLYLMFAIVSGASSAWAQTDKCGGSAIANGPFNYTATGPTSATFNGTGGSAVTTSFTVNAPNASGPDVVFPGQGQNPCVGEADATIGVLDIEQIADASGNLLSQPVDIGETNPSLYGQIAAAFTLSPDSNTFTPGSSVAVSVTVNNPDVDSANFGEYQVKLAAQAPGAGIGVGAGVEFDLTLAAPAVTDTTCPVVTVTAPSTDQFLGVIGVTIQAYDPSPGSGLVSMSASISSAGHTISNVAIPLTLDSTLPAAAGTTVTGTGSYTPAGGTGTAGTTDAGAFTSSSRSGIGTYVLTATATDVAGNTCSTAQTFKVKYNVFFTKASVPSGCSSAHTSSCTGMFQFDVNRDNVTSDGAFIYDHTVEVELVDGSNNVVATHLYGTGDINSEVQISSTPAYQTDFKHSVVTSSSTLTSYQAEALFLDVDGNLVLEGTSSSVTF